MLRVVRQPLLSTCVTKRLLALTNYRITTDWTFNCLLTWGTDSIVEIFNEISRSLNNFSPIWTFKTFAWVMVPVAASAAYEVLAAFAFNQFKQFVHFETPVATELFPTFAHLNRSITDRVTSAKSSQVKFLELWVVFACFFHDERWGFDFALWIETGREGLRIEGFEFLFQVGLPAIFTKLIPTHVFVDNLVLKTAHIANAIKAWQGGTASVISDHFMAGEFFINKSRDKIHLPPTSLVVNQGPILVKPGEFHDFKSLLANDIH